MEKSEYERLRLDIISRLGKPEYDPIEPTKPVNEAARELKRLFSGYQSERMKERYAKIAGEKKEQILDVVQQKELVKVYRRAPAIPIELSELDLQPFGKAERDIITRYFGNTNLTPAELETPTFSKQRVVALMRCGPFQVLATRVFEYLMPLEVRNAVLKAIREGDKRLIERFAEQTGVLKNQELNLNVNKPLIDETINAKLKELGDKSL